MAKANDWFYFKSSGGQSKSIGPFSDDQLVAYLKQGVLEPSDKLTSASKTGGKWIEISNFPKAMALYEKTAPERDAAIAKRKAEEQKVHAAEKEKQQREAAAKRQEWEAQIRSVTDASSLSNAAKIRDEVSEILTTNETIMYIAIQTKPIAVKADAVVATTKRLIFYRPKVVGRVSFEDFLWRELSDAHITAGVIASTFTCKHVNGSVIKMDYLDKKSGRKLYRLAQEQEEIAFETRREMVLEEKRAGAGNFGYAAPPPQQAPAVPSAAGGGSIADKLKQIKELLDAGLISQEDYEAKKASLIENI
ncbi:PH domain-containing protein [Phycisphaeraceae bacterium D3-23]